MKFPLYQHRHGLRLEAGFTLVELIVAIFGFTLIIWGLVGLFSNLFYSSTQQSNLLADTDQARQLAFKMATELRNAQTAANGAYVLDTAASQQLIFYSNADQDSSIERIRYFVQNGALYKGVTEYSGSAYNTSTEKTVLVQKDLANGGSPVFYYYDGSYTGAAGQNPLVQPVNVTQVKFVKISLQIYNKAGMQNTNAYTVTAGAAIRNIKTNLGS
ncbi:MAG TPA: hypothetical protein VHA30_01295 [Patescibacteria group bacterium]|nr:hypothetical protein [Patescibacteria group bacterium]